MILNSIDTYLKLLYLKYDVHVPKMLFRILIFREK